MRAGTQLVLAAAVASASALLWSTHVPMAYADSTSTVAATGTPQSAPSPVLQELSYTVTPIVAHEKAKPRDIIKQELLVTNNTAQRMDLYISVANVDPTNGTQAFSGPAETDLSRSLANWIEITRGVIELSPNESRKVPYLIHVNLTAKPGSYFARIALTKGPYREDAAQKPAPEGTALLLNVEVGDDAKERLQLGTFVADGSVVFGESVGFSYLLENVGNRLVEPRGSIRIFNRRGEEVGSVPLNADGSEISPDAKKQLAAVWSAAGRFGKYKAFLDLEYGEDQLASVQDTLYFWVFPWKEIGVALIGVLVLAVVGTLVVHLRAVARPRPVAVASLRRSDPYTPQTSWEYTAPGRSASLAAPPSPRGIVQAPQAAVRSTPGTVQLSPRARPTAHGSTIQVPRRS